MQPISVSVYDLNNGIDFFEALRWKVYNTHVVLHLDCPKSATFLRNISTNEALNGSYSIFAFASDWNSSFEVMTEMNINYDSRVLLILDDDLDSDELYNVFEVTSLEHSSGTDLLVEFVGSCSSFNCKLTRRQATKDFQQHVMKITTNVSVTLNIIILFFLEAHQRQTFDCFLIFVQCLSKAQWL